jgi:hypothetical protein
MNCFDCIDGVCTMNCSKQHSVAIQTIASRNAEKQRAARVMLAALQTTRLQLHVALAGKYPISIEKQLSIVDAAIAQAEMAGITAPETRHARDCAYVTTSGPAPCTCAAGITAEG